MKRGTLKSVAAMLSVAAWAWALLLFTAFSATPVHAAFIVGYNATNISIPDYPGNQVSSPVTLTGAPAGSQITSIDIYYEIRHPYSGDLKVWLTAYYNGAWHDYVLRNRTGGSADDIVESRDGLTLWNGASPNQTWYLVAQDLATGDVGYIDYFQINVNYSTGQPDLTKSADNLSNLNPHPGDVVTASITIQNSTACGSATAGASHIGFYWSTSSSFSGVTPFLRSSIGSVTAGGTASLAQNITINSATTPGTYYLGYKIDDQGEVSECNENNNGIYYWTVNVQAAAKPDLTKSSDNLSDLNPHPGDVVTTSVTVQNSTACGSATASASHIGFYWSTSSSFSGVAPFLEAALGSIAANGTASLSQNITISASTTPGTYYLGYKIDDQNEVSECNENNNGINYWTVNVSGVTDDHGNSIGTATTVGTTSTTSGRINYAGDNDYFRVQVGSAGHLKVYTTGSTDTYGYLLDSNGNTLASNDDTTGLNFQIDRDVSPGTYYLRVRHYSSSGTGNYVLEVRLAGVVVDDHGNSTGTATSVGTTSTTSGRINSAGDNDYFRVQVGSAGHLTVYTTGSTDTYGYLLDSNGNTIISNDDTIGYNFQIERDVSPGTYYVRVRHYSSTGTGDYVLEVRFTGSLTDDHGNSTATATSVGINSTTGGVINYAGDNDYFSVAVTGSGHLTLYTTGTTDTYGYLLDSGGNTVTSNDDSGGPNFRIERDVTPGTYYVRVRHYSVAAATGNYQLQVAFTSSASETHVVLLLHGVFSAETAWNDLMEARSANYGILWNGTLVGAGPSGNQPTPDAQGVYYYSVRFGSADTSSGYQGLNQETGSEDVPAAGPSHGDYSDFNQLGEEVRSAVAKIKSLHPNTNLRIAIVAHSRGGLATRAFLQGTSVERAAIVGFVTLGTPHAGSRLARAYEYLRTHPKNSHTADDDWDAEGDLAWLASLGGLDLDLKRPGIKFMADNSAQITNLSLGISQLPPGLAYGLVEFQGLRLGILMILYQDGEQLTGYDAFHAENLFHEPDFFTSTARSYILDGQAIDTFSGDGVVHTTSQRLYSLPGYPNGSVPSNRRRVLQLVGHTDETGRTADFFPILQNIVSWWNN